MFYLNTVVRSEPEAVRTNAQRLRSLGARPAIITGKSSAKRCGALDDVLEALELREPLIFDRIEENPTVATVREAARWAREQEADFVIGIGGGSPMDAAKAVAWLMTHPQAGEKELYDPALDDSHAPLALIPTTCGTGSEVTGISVLTLPEEQTKRSIAHRVYAELALLDGKYLISASPKLIADTYMDCMCHAFESYFNTRANEYSRYWASMAMRGQVKGNFLWTGNSSEDRITFVPIDEPEVRQRLMEIAMLAGMAIDLTGTSLPHGLSYSLTVKLGIPHGRAAGYFLPGYLAKASEKVEEREEIKVMLEAYGMKTPEGMAEYFESYYPMPDIPDSILEEAAEELSRNEAKLAAAPFYRTDLETLRYIAFYMKKRG